MSNIKFLRNRIRSINTTKQITTAMQLMSSVRLGQLKDTIPGANNAMENLTQIMLILLKKFRNTKIESDILKRLATPQENTPKLTIVFTSDKGLCGSFNSALLRKLHHYISTHDMQNDKFILIGRKCVKFFHIEGLDNNIINCYDKDGLSVLQLVEQLIEDVLKYYKTYHIQCIFNEFKNIMIQKPLVQNITDFKQYKNNNDYTNCIQRDYEIDYKNIDATINGVFLAYLRGTLHRIILHSRLGEEAARQQAMDSANRNAEDLINKLTLKVNRIRQDGITQEISEIVNSVESFS